MASPVFITGWAQQSYSTPRAHSQHSQHQIRDSVLGWNQAVSEINALLDNHKRGKPGDGENYRGITTGHWTPSGSRTHCAGHGCKTKFGLLKDRHHHCRRCGDLFCKPCCRYKRRLNVLANPDPNGKLYPVCQACFDQGPQTMGQFRSWTSIYQQFTASAGTCSVETGAGSRESSHGDSVVSIENFREKVNIQQECTRLKEGFKVCVNSPGWKRALHVLDVKNVVKVPEWQKASYYLNGTLASTCSECSEAFSLARGRHICKVCGAGVCSACSKRQLIVFIPNGEPLDSEPKLAIIKIVGCPLKEPDRCAYLRVCQYCSTILQDQQVNEYTELQDDSWDDIIKVNDLLSGVQVKIERQLPKYQELIEALEVMPGSAGGLPWDMSNTEILAQAQGDLAVHFTQWVMVLQRMKGIKPNSNGQMVICRNMIRCKCEFYQENMYMFHSLRRKLEAVTPPDVLVCIQRVMDRNNYSRNRHCSETIPGKSMPSGVLPKASFPGKRINRFAVWPQDLLRHLQEKQPRLRRYRMSVTSLSPEGQIQSTPQLNTALRQQSYPGSLEKRNKKKYRIPKLQKAYRVGWRIGTVRSVGAMSYSKLSTQWTQLTRQLYNVAGSWLGEGSTSASSAAGSDSDSSVSVREITGN